MILYPTAKINLGLYITSKREDGFHNIETLFYPLGLTDILEFIPSLEQSEDEFSTSGLLIPGDKRDNLLLKACAMFRRVVEIPYLKIHLHKRIPMGAGLGGGSADASFLLKGLNEEFGNHLNHDTLAGMALLLGSDCPYFLKSVPAIGLGRGEILSDFSIDLSGFWFYLFHPGIHVSTREAYGGVTPKSPDIPLGEVLRRPISDWRRLLENGFETSVFEQYPEIKWLKEKLYDLGAVYASMSGSGSAVFGLFKDLPVLDSKLEECLVWSGRL